MKKQCSGVRIPVQIIFSLLFLSQTALRAQDPQFTQFYAAPMYLNPAFTGVTYEHRFVLNYRNQWPGVSKAYQTYMAAYDYNMSELKSGFGFTAMQDRAGTSGLTHTQFGFNYSYHANISKLVEIRGGLGLSYNMVRLDFNKLRFNDQLATGSSVSLEQSNYEPLQYMDINAGALLNSEEYWAGFSLKHLNRPNSSLMGERVALPVTFSLHGGYRHVINKRGRDLRRYVSPAFNYRHEGKYDQLDLGIYYYALPINLGIWYRGIPFKKYAPTYNSSESVAILVGTDITQYNLRIGYSYDITVSKLGVVHSLGSHEISLVYEIAKKRKRSRRVLVSCPKF